MFPSRPRRHSLRLRGSRPCQTRERFIEVGILSSHGLLQADVVVRTLDELPEDAFDRLVLE